MNKNYVIYISKHVKSHFINASQKITTTQFHLIRKISRPWKIKSKIIPLDKEKIAKISQSYHERLASSIPLHVKLHVIDFCISAWEYHWPTDPPTITEGRKKNMCDNIVFAFPDQSPRRISNMIYCVHSLPGLSPRI